ncbi:MAG: hypothetical protein U1F43_11455 [Myxococcota bacterium]
MSIAPQSTDPARGRAGEPPYRRTTVPDGGGMNMPNAVCRATWHMADILERSTFPVTTARRVCTLRSITFYFALLFMICERRSRFL